MRMKKAVFVLVVVSLMINLCGCAHTNPDEGYMLIRIHIRADSNSAADQGVKLKVRDAVLEAGEDLFDGTLTAEGAEQMLDSDIERLQNAAQTVLTENGFDYGVRVEIGKDYFNTRTYDGEVTLPAGEYEAVRVILGEGKGQNWWCVMFPPMCLPAAEADTEISDVLTKNEEDVVKSNPKYEARFKIVELFENFYRKIK